MSTEQTQSNRPDLTPESPPELVESVVAAMDDATFDRQRPNIAKATGLRVGTLDKMRKSARSADPSTSGAGRAIDLNDPEPLEDTEDGATLLDDLVDLVNQYIVLPEGAAPTVALWAAFTWTFEAFDICPNLGANAATKGSGKTVVLSFLSRVCRRAIGSSNLTASAVFRLIGKLDPAPTLLIDEAETHINDPTSDVTGVLNSGFNRRMAYVLRSVDTGDDFDVRAFPTWAPKAFAFNGTLPGTLQDRSIVLTMMRKLSTERVKHLRENRDVETFDRIRRRLATWARDNMHEIDSDPEMPTWMGNREADKWSPLIAIADAVGGHWPDTAREAARLLSAEDDTDIKVRLLRDIAAIFEAAELERITSSAMAERLAEIEDAPWSEWGKSRKPITPQSVAKLLKPFGVAPKALKFSGATHNGYTRDAFEEVWARYTPRHSLNPSTFEDNSLQQNELHGWDLVEGRVHGVNPGNTVEPSESTLNPRLNPSESANYLHGNDLPSRGWGVEPMTGVGGDGGVSEDDDPGAQFLDDIPPGV